MLLKADYRNVVDYLAGLGFLEVASWLSPFICAQWTPAGIDINAIEETDFKNVVQCLCAATVELDVTACKDPDDPPKESPLLLRVQTRSVPLNAWLDRFLQRKSIWSPGVSGQVSAMGIVKDLLGQVNRLKGAANPDLILSIKAGFAVNDCSQFRFDGGTAWTTLDTGFSPNDSGITIAARPFAELFSIIGAQSFFPQSTATKREDPYFFVWNSYLPVSLCRLAARGMITVNVSPLSGKWLDAGKFGAFSFLEEI